MEHPIVKASVHPATAAVACNIRDGKAAVTVDRPGLFTVDINGQMDDQDTGKLPDSAGGGQYDGPPIHTLTIFANPFISKPSADDPGVKTVAPGEQAPTDGDWSTLFFLPGVHDVGLSFTLHSNKSYYIPGDAIVYGTMNNNKDWAPPQAIRIFGHGTLSGDRIPHPT